jgi:hypothetical protein
MAGATSTGSGAHVRARTGDLFLTKEVLCLLSYVGVPSMASPRAPVSQDGWTLRNHRSTFGNLWIRPRIARLESLRMDVMVGREGIEPPQSKTADLQSAELTTCSTYPRIAAGAWCLADRGRSISDGAGTLNRATWCRGWESNPQPRRRVPRPLPTRGPGVPRKEARPEDSGQVLLRSGPG